MSGRNLEIGKHLIGDGFPCYIIAEIGINHNGSLDIAKNLIDAAVDCGCNAVKFQKRTIAVVYTPEELEKPRENPFGPTNGDLKRGLELGFDEYSQIDAYCRQKGIDWFASCWDRDSVDFMKQFDPVCYKIASATITDDALLQYHRTCNKPILASVGMSDLEIIEHAVEVLGNDDLALLHCTSTYPSAPEELNLRFLETLHTKYSDIPIGYSGHEVGLATSAAAVAMGACIIERHITLDRAMWGSDQAASIEPQGFKRLNRDIRTIEKAMGNGIKVIYESEKVIAQKLRRVCWK